MVEIEVGHGVLVFLRALVEPLLVVDVAGIYAEHVVQHVGVVDRVAHPLYVGDVILVALLKVDEHVHALVVVARHAVIQYLCVAIAEFVVLLHDAVEVISEILLHELLLFEEVEKIAVLVGLFHRTLHLRVGHHLVAVDVDLVHLDFVAAVYIHLKHDVVLLAEVGDFADFHFRVLEPLLGVVTFDELLHLSHYVGRDLLPLHHSKVFLYVFLLAAFDACEAQFRHARLLFEVNRKPRLVAGNLVNLDLHL